MKHSFYIVVIATLVITRGLRSSDNNIENNKYAVIDKELFIIKNIDEFDKKTKTNFFSTFIFGEPVTVYGRDYTKPLCLKATLGALCIGTLLRFIINNRTKTEKN